MSERIVLPSDDFDRLVAKLEAEPVVLPKLVELLKLTEKESE
jgi:hypothetical protein